MGVAERKEREKEQRRNDIIDAAEAVFFSKGYDNATMDEVAEKAEFSKGTLYIYFKNKNELLHAISARALEILYSWFSSAVEKEKTGIDKVRAIGRTYYEFFIKEPDYYNALLHDEKIKIHPGDLEENEALARCEEWGHKIFQLIEDMVRVGIADGTIRNDLRPELMPLILWGHSTGLFHLMGKKKAVLEQHFNITTQEVVLYSADLIMDYLRPLKDKSESEVQS